MPDILFIFQIKIVKKEKQYILLISLFLFQFFVPLFLCLLLYRPVRPQFDHRFVTSAGSINQRKVIPPCCRRILFVERHVEKASLFSSRDIVCTDTFILHDHHHVSQKIYNDLRQTTMQLHINLIGIILKSVISPCTYLNVQLYFCLFSFFFFQIFQIQF